MKKCYGITEGRTDGRTDGMTDRCKPVYPPLFQSGGIIIIMLPNLELPSLQYFFSYKTGTFHFHNNLKDLDLDL